MKKLLIALFAAAAFTVSAQSTRSGNWAIEFPKDVKDAINVSQTFTPFFKIENDVRVFNSSEMINTVQKDMNKAKHWLALDIMFYANKSKNSAATRWPKWLDNVEVEVNVFIPAPESGLGGYVIGGKQMLASLQADDGKHFVRVMIPPDVIYRYFPFEGTSGDLSKDYGQITSGLKKIAGDLPIMVAITYAGRTVYAVQPCGKEIFSRLEKAQGSSQSAKLFYTYLKPSGEGNPTLASTTKLFNYINQNKLLNPQTFKYLPDELLPVSKTPFAWVLFDRFEPIKESAGK